MWYDKNVRIDDIAKRIADKDFSLTAQNIMKLKIVEHCILHNIGYKKIQEIERKLHIPSNKMINRNLLK